MYISELIRFSLSGAWGLICGLYIPDLGLGIFAAVIGALIINKLVD